MHLQSKHSCPYCVAEITSSQAEQDIVDFIQKYYQGKIERNNRTILENKEIDILLPEINLGIEFNGNYWHTEAIVGRNYHLDKTTLAEQKNIKLLQIFEYEWNNKKEIVLSRILSHIGKNKKIGARKTKVVELTSEDKNNFLNRTHIQGKDNSSIFLGLEHEGQLVACMTFGKPRYNKKYQWELIRYSSELYVNVIGGASKLLSHFTHEGNIISYADQRWSVGNLYKQLGFNLVGKTNPGYIYYHIKNKNTLHRSNCQKNKLKKMPFYSDELTEYEIMKLNGFERIWNSGNFVFEY